MSLAVAKAARLKPEIRLAQALSEYEAILADEQKAKLRGYRQESPPTAADVMRLTAEIDKDAVRMRKSRRCVGPRLYNFLQAVQMFTGVVDIVVGGAQSLIASAIWGVVKLSLQLTSTIPSYFEQLSVLFMSIGRICPRNQEYLLLYPRSVELKEAVCEYFIVSVQLCKKAVLVLKRPVLGQLLSALSNTIMSDLGGFEQILSRLAGNVAEEVTLASRRLQVQDAEHNSKFRLTSLTTSTEIKKWRNEQMKRRFLKACSTYDYQAAWKQIRKQGNVAWFLMEQAYIDWATQTASSVLHCVGTLGSGKSVLTANIIDELVARDPTRLVVYFFCRYDDAQSLLPRTIIGSIAAQILSQLKLDTSKVVSELQLKALGTDEIFEALQKILSTNVRKAHKLCIVLDGVDECKDTDARIVLKYLNSMINSSIHIHHIFCSSRPNISQWASEILPPRFTLSMSASGCRDEMDPYIVDALETSLETRRLSIGNPDIITKIRNTLLKNSHGMYLWVALQIENICSQPTDKAILNALENIPKDLPETFNRILQKLRNTKENAPLSTYSVTLFRIVATARRPLTLDELREAVSVEPGETAWDPDQLVNDMHKLISSCGSLLIVDEEKFTVRFIHRSVRQFLCSQLVDERVKEYKIDLASADLDLGLICVTYLNSERHISQLVKQKPQLTASSSTLRKTIPSSNIVGKMAIRLLSSNKEIIHSMRPSLEAAGALSSPFSSHSQLYNLFLPYAQENWLCHTTELRRTTHPIIWDLWRRLATGEVKTIHLPWSPEDCTDLGPAFIDFLLNTHQWNLLSMSIGRAKGSALTNLKPIYGILRMQVEMQVEVQEDSLAKSEDIRQLVKVLGHCISHYNPSPALYEAAHIGYLDYVQCLLTNGAAVNLQDGYFDTALQVACCSGHEAVVKLLLESGAEVNLQGGKYNTALQASSDQGHEAIVKSLLENGADTNLRGGFHGTALKAACLRGNTSIVKLLLANGAHVNLKDGGIYATALQAASLEGREEIVKILLENGADVNLQGGFYATPLQAACCMGHEATVKLLLANGADVKLQGGYWGTALEAAQANRRHGIVVLLLYHRATENHLKLSPETLTHGTK